MVEGVTPTEGALIRRTAYLLLEDPDVLRTFRELLKPEHFPAPELRFLISFALTFYEKHHTAPGLRAFRLEVESPQRAWELTGVRPELMVALANALETDVVPPPNEVQYIVDRLESYIQEREFEQAVRAAGQYLDEGDLKKAFEVVRAAQRIQVRKDEHLIFPDDISMVLEHFDPERLGRVSLSTGIPTLDAALSGGLRPGELGVIMAPLKRGKSMALVHLGATALVRGISAVHYSLENSAYDTYARYISHLVGGSVEEMLRDKVDERELKARAELMLQRVDSDAQVFIKWLPSKVTSVADLEADLEELCADHPIGLVIVDYGDLARSRQRHERTYEEQADVFAELRDLGIKYNVPLWTATQANRRALDMTKVVMSTIAESLGKAMKADFVVAMSQTSDERDEQPPQMRLDVVAARRGRGGHVRVEARFDRAKLVEMESQNGEESYTD